MAYPHRQVQTASVPLCSQRSDTVDISVADWFSLLFLPLLDTLPVCLSVLFRFAYQSWLLVGDVVRWKNKAFVHFTLCPSVIEAFQNQSCFLAQESSYRLERIKKDSALCWLKPGWRQNAWTKEHGRWSRLMNILTGKMKIWSRVLLQMLLFCSNHLSCRLFSFLCSLKAAFVTFPDAHEYSRAAQDYLSWCWLSQADLC